MARSQCLVIQDVDGELLVDFRVREYLALVYQRKHVDVIVVES